MLETSQNLFSVIHAFPLELWSTIISLLSHRDILSLTSTCRALHKIQGLKLTWIHILNSICGEQGLYPPSFPSDEMDVSQLQRAAKGSTYHWPNLVKEFGYRYPHHSRSHSSGEDICGPELEISRAPRSLNPISKVDLAPEIVEDMKKFLLIPGGRYLLIAGTRYLRLLDLGPAGTRSLEKRGGAPCITAQIELASGPDPSSRPDEFQFICDLVAEILEDGETLRVAIASNLIVKVYDVVLRPENPSFEQLGVIRFGTGYHPGRKWALSFLGERLFLRAETRVLAWNFITGRYILGPGIGIWTSQSMCTENLYIGFNDEAILIWYIPSWDANTKPVPASPLPYDLNDQSVTPPQPRINRSLDWSISLNYDEFQSDGEIGFVLPSGSSQNNKLPILFDMFFLSCPFSAEIKPPTVAYRYSLDVVVRDGHGDPSSLPGPSSVEPSKGVIQEVKFEQKAYWKFPSDRFEFFPMVTQSPHPGGLEHGYSSTALVRNYLGDHAIPPDFRVRDAIYSLVKDPPNGEDKQDQYPDLVLTKLHGDTPPQKISFCKSACRSVYTAIEDGQTRAYVADYLA
ncbi:hypothetical protein EST38_g9444 [Candolleomyces aberdarensis]|uniref:F-box domain-containing protein n=1 Tax=Candolleomyces aberdarensis TaxID=2316362 RepID=A0A4Q2DD64_9AGAR|nr:hypothetical protein EST38_g9444 [Candolleomyces aberdarensis]